MATHTDDLAFLLDTEAYWWEHGLRVTERTTSHPTTACHQCTQALTEAIAMAMATGSVGCNASRAETDGTVHEARWHRAPVAGPITDDRSRVVAQAIEDWYTALYPFGIRLTFTVRAALADSISHRLRLADDAEELREAAG